MPLDPAGASDPPRRFGGLYRWLSAPILVAVVVALLVNYVIPRISEESENHRRALEIKTGLVTDISRSVADAIISSRFVAGDIIKKESGVQGQQRFYDSGLREWEQTRAEIQAQLAAYFPKTPLGDEWRLLATAVTSLYTLSGTEIPDREDRIAAIRAIRVGENIDWCALRTERPRADRQNECGLELTRDERDNHFRAEYARIGDLLLRSTDAYVTDVLDTDLSGF